MSLLTRYFDLPHRATTVSREARGAVATFLTMAYILFVNPAILKAAGVPFEPAVAATALAAGICCILMGLFANFPIALASGMGLNAVVAAQVVPLIVALRIAPAEQAWKVAMGLVVLDGVIVLLLVLSGLREAVMNAIPRDLRLATGAGIGLFIALIGLVHAKVVVLGNPGAPLAYGSLRSPPTAIAMIGLLVTAFLLARRINGALVLGILLCTVVALFWGQASLPKEIARPHFDTLFQADIRSALKLSLMPLLFSLIMVDFFDTLGTATAIATQAGLHDEKGRIPGIRNLLVVDSISAAVGGLAGVSSVTCYVESAAGVAEGARTGLHTVIVGLLFLACIVLAPVASIVPESATAPALILVGFLMISQMARIDFHDPETAIPAFITLLVIPMTYSIAHGIGYGFIVFVVIKVLSLKFREVHPLMYVVAAAFAVYFLWPHVQPG